MKTIKVVVFFIVTAIYNVAFAKEVDISKIQVYLNSIKTLEADFKQDGEGDPRFGRLYISKPYKIKWDYTFPKPSLIIGNKKRFVYYDPKMKEVTYIPSKKIPGFFLSYKEVVFGENLSVVSSKQTNNSISIDVQDSIMKEAMAKVRLSFHKSPIAIESISIIDMSQDTEIIISLSNLKVNQQIPDDIFEFKDPNFFKPIT